MPFQPYFKAVAYDYFMQIYKELNKERAMQANRVIQANRVRLRGVDPLDMWRGDYHLADEVIDQNKKEQMRRKVLDEKTRDLVEQDSDGYIRGIVHISKNYVEFGWFKSSPENIVIFLNLGGWRGFGRAAFTGISREALPGLMWSNKLGYYIVKDKLPPEEILGHQLVRGQGNFLYQFPKHYEAAESFHLFKDAQKVLEDVQYPLSKELGYTFGLEFETSMGYIPQEICFRDGLIPLRDGSISGIEYSTVVLKGNRGLNLLKQQLDTLKEYTKFNKECALHIHMGGYPVDPIYIFALYSLWYAVERELENREYVPRMTFHTSAYKANGKDYCNKLSGRVSTFEQLFEKATGKKYLGSLVQPHPADIEKKAKWNIKARYYGLNLINMLCYKGPKTVEFRFLRPSFNYRKITLWLYILNAVLKYAESLAKLWKREGNCDTENMINWIVSGKYSNLMDILREVYDEDTVNYLSKELMLLRLAVQAQHRNGDECGRDIEFEEELFV